MKRPDMMVLQDLIDEMYSMDSEEMMKRRRNKGGGPTITIAIGEGKPKEEGEMEMEEEKPADYGVPVSTPMADMEDDDEGDDEEDMLCEEARSLGIPDPESMDMRLLKKLIEKKKMG